MIIIGYQGIGKSTLAGKANCIDLESGNFWVDGKRDEKWYIPYCNIAEHLSSQGYTVFVSSHEVVRNQLKNSNEEVYIVCPSLDLKDQWVQKLKDRYESTQLEKDYKAYMNAADRYTENISELINSGIECYQIQSMDYDLCYDFILAKQEA
jgi:hypothetical protein